MIHLFYHEGYQTAQIAKVLGRNESTVRSDLRRGREKLKEVLKGEYDFEKYDEIMNKIEVDEAMHKRILSYVENLNLETEKAAKEK